MAIKCLITGQTAFCFIAFDSHVYDDLTKYDSEYHFFTHLPLFKLIKGIIDLKVL